MTRARARVGGEFSAAFLSAKGSPPPLLTFAALAAVREAVLSGAAPGTEFAAGGGVDSLLELVSVAPQSVTAAALSALADALRAGGGATAAAFFSWGGGAGPLLLSLWTAEEARLGVATEPCSGALGAIERPLDGASPVTRARTALSLALGPAAVAVRGMVVGGARVGGGGVADAPPPSTESNALAESTAFRGLRRALRASAMLEGAGVARPHDVAATVPVATLAATTDVRSKIYAVLEAVDFGDAPSPTSDVISSVDDDGFFVRDAGDDDATTATTTSALSPPPPDSPSGRGRNAAHDDIRRNVRELQHIGGQPAAATVAHATLLSLRASARAPGAAVALAVSAALSASPRASPRAPPRAGYAAPVDLTDPISATLRPSDSDGKVGGVDGKMGGEDDLSSRLSRVADLVGVPDAATASALVGALQMPAPALFPGGAPRAVGAAFGGSLDRAHAIALEAARAYPDLLLGHAWADARDRLRRARVDPLPADARALGAELVAARAHAARVYNLQRLHAGAAAADTLRADEGVWAAARHGRDVDAAATLYATRNKHRPWILQGKVPQTLTLSERRAAIDSQAEMMKTSHVGYRPLPGVQIVQSPLSVMKEDDDY